MTVKLLSCMSSDIPKIFQIKVTDLRLMRYCELCEDGCVLEEIIG